MSHRSHSRARALRHAALARVKPAAVVRHTGGGFLRTGSIHGHVRGDPYRAHATVFRCVRVIVSAFKRPDLVCKKGVKPNGVTVTSGPWAEIMTYPNPWQTERQMLEATGTYLLLTGECGWVLFDPEWNPAGLDTIPRYIVPVPKTAIEIDYGQDYAQGPRSFQGYKVQLVNGENIDVPPWSMVHIHYAMDPTDPLRGIGPITAAAMAMSSDMKAEAWSDAFFDNAAEPGGILTTDGVLSPKQREDMREAWEAKHRGYTKHARIAVLEGGLTYQQVGISQRDMDFLNQRQWNDTQIARVFGVPKFFLMDDADTSYASTRQHKRSLWELAVLPLIENVEDVAYARMTSPRDSTIYLDFDLAQVEALGEDLALNVETAGKLTQLGYPLNEVNERLKLDMKSQPWGDEGVLPLGLAPASEVAEGTEEDPDITEPPDEGGENEEGGPDSNPEALPQEDKATDPIRGNGVHGRGDLDPSIVVPEDVQAEEFYERRRAWRAVYRSSMRPFTRKYQRGVSALFLAMGRDTAERLKSLDIRRAAEAIDRTALLRAVAEGRELPPSAGGALEDFIEEATEKWSKSLRRRTRPVILQVADAAAGQAGKELGGLTIANVTDQIVNPAVAQQMAVKRMEGMIGTAKEEIRRELSIGLALGEEINDLQARIDKATDNNLSRSLTIARTEVAQTTNQVRQDTFRDEGVARQMWSSSNDAFVRDEVMRGGRYPVPASHRDLDGDVVALGEPYVGETGNGNPLMFPGDVRAAPQWVVNCRCTTLPVRE